MAEAPEKNLALDIVRITEAAALASARWLGRGDKEAGDGAAVDAMAGRCREGFRAEAFDLRRGRA